MCRTLNTCKQVNKQMTHLFSEPLLSLQSLLPPLDLTLVDFFIFLLFLTICSHPVHVETIIWRKDSKGNGIEMTTLKDVLVHLLSLN